MTFIQVCDGCGKARVEPDDNDMGTDNWRVYRGSNMEAAIAKFSTKKFYELHFHSDRCAREGMKLLDEGDMDLVAWCKKHDIELEY